MIVLIALLAWIAILCLLCAALMFACVAAELKTPRRRK